MGKRTRERKEAFFKDHPNCIFCGGAANTTTIEHCPPRAMFQDRQWPEGFEFPACAACNNGSSNDDVLVAMIARMDPFTMQGDKDGRLVGIMKNVNAQYPGMFQKMRQSAAEARRTNRDLGISPRAGQTHQEAGPVNVTVEMHKAVCVFAGKLAKAIYYMTTRSVFPNNGCLLLNWFTNAELLRHGKYPVFDLLKEVPGNSPALERSGKFLNDQFEYKLSISHNGDVFVLQASFGKGFGMAAFGSTVPGRLESIVDRLRSDTGKDGPFAIIQSSLLEIDPTLSVGIAD